MFPIDSWLGSEWLRLADKKPLALQNISVIALYNELSSDLKTLHIGMRNNLGDYLLQVTHHITKEVEDQRIFSAKGRTDLRKQSF